ncbi:MAG: SpoIIIAH-like family protein [Eubacteriales bacterium]
MNIFKRNQVVITALVIMIAIAGYLNFTQKNIPESDDMITTDNSNVETGALVPNDDGIVMEDNQEQDDSQEENQDQNNENEDVTETTSQDGDIDGSDPGEAIFTNNNVNIGDFFISAKIEREQTRARVKEDYLEVIDGNNIPDEEKEKANDELIELQKRIENEAAAEDMLKAKGFENVYVRINSETDTVDVVVSEQELGDAKTAQITDVVKRTTGFPADNIIITPLNLSE